MPDIRAQIPGNRLPDISGDELVRRDVWDVTGLVVGRVTEWRSATDAFDVELSSDGRDAIGRGIASVVVPLAWVSDVREDGVHLSRPGTDLPGDDRAPAWPWARRAP